MRIATIRYPLAVLAAVWGMAGGCSAPKETSRYDRQLPTQPDRQAKPVSTAAGASSASSTSRASPRIVDIVDTGSISVASYNINAGMTGNPSTRKAIAELNVDIIALQEVTEGWKQQIEELFDGSFPHRRFYIDPRQHYGGLAILSKFPISRDEILTSSAGPFAAWRGELETPIGNLQLVNVHLFPPVRWFRSRGVAGAYQDGQLVHLKELKDHLAGLKNDAAFPTMVVGDFNENRDGKGIQWLFERGYKSAHQGYEPTWRWTLQNGFEVTFQLDHILIRGLDASNAKVHTGGKSDHRPISATIFKSSTASAKTKPVPPRH